MSETTNETVLVPLDGSALSDAILEPIEGLLDGDAYEAVLLRVLIPPSAGDLPGRAEQELELATTHLATTRARLEARGARVTTTLRYGNPAAEILAAVAELRPGLVAMSSHGELEYST